MLIEVNNRQFVERTSDHSRTSGIASQNDVYPDKLMVKANQLKLKPKLKERQSTNLTNMVTDLNKSGEVLMRDNPADTLLMTPDYVLSQQINSKNQTGSRNFNDDHTT